MVLVVPTQRWINNTIVIPWIGRVTRNGSRAIEVDDKVANWLLTNCFAKLASEVAPLEPVDLPFPLPADRPPDPKGQPATEHLSSEGRFATVNPAGAIVHSLVDPKAQDELATELPDSVKRLREANIEPKLVVELPGESVSHLSSDDQFATKNPAGVRIHYPDMSQQDIVATETPHSLEEYGSKADPRDPVENQPEAASHLSSDGTFATANPAGVVLPVGALQEAVVASEVPPSLEKANIAKAKIEESSNNTWIEPFLAFLNDASKDNKAIAATFSGIGTQTADKLITARPLDADAVRRILTDRQLSAARSWAEEQLKAESETPLPAEEATHTPPDVKANQSPGTPTSKTE